MKSIKIPQVLNGALAASVYICGAQAVGPMAVAAEFPPDQIDWLAVWAGAMIFLWTTKNFVDDFRAFDGEADQGFNLGFTVFFSAAAYGMLALSAASLSSGAVAVSLLVVYFAVLVVWSAASWWRRRTIANPTDTEKERMARRKRWIAWHSIAAFLTYIIATQELGIWVVLSGILVLGIYAYDVADCQTFSTKDIEAA